MKAWSAVDIQFFLDNVEFQVNHDNIYSTLTTPRFVLALNKGRLCVRVKQL